MNDQKEIARFIALCPEYYDSPRNGKIIEKYLKDNNLPLIADTLCAAYMLHRNLLEKKPTRLRPDDINAPGKSGLVNRADRQSGHDRVAQDAAKRKQDAIDREKIKQRQQAESDIAAYRVVTAGKINWAKTRSEQLRLTEILNSEGPEAVAAALKKL